MAELRDVSPRTSRTEKFEEWSNGWRLALAGCGGLFTVTLYVYSMGLFLSPLQKEFAWSSAQISAGMLIVGAAAVVGNPIVGMLLDRMGPARLALWGVIAQAAALAGLSLSGPSIYSWWVGWIFVAMTALPVCVPVWDISVMKHFRRRRGLAIACVYAGSSLAALCVPFVTKQLIDAFGWRGAYVGVGAIALTVGGAAALLLRSVPIGWTSRREGAPVADRREAKRAVLCSTAFWRVVISAVIVTIAVIALTVHFVSIASERAVTRDQAALLAGVIGLAGLAGRFGAGLLLDRLHVGRVGAVVFCLPAIVCLVLACGAEGPIAMAALALGVGASLGAELDIMAYLCSRYFKPGQYGFALGVLTGLVGGASGAGAVIAGILHDYAGSYDNLLAVLAGGFLTSAVLTLSLGRYPSHTEMSPNASAGG